MIVNIDGFVKIKIDNFTNYKINKKGEIINFKNILIKPALISGYYKIQLTNINNDSKHFFVHRLVALTFIDNPNNYEIVNHIDENKLNNNSENLQWYNHKQNITHSCGKKINQIDIKINKIIKTFNSINDAYLELNKNYGSNIRLVCNGQRNQAFGFKWSFV